MDLLNYLIGQEVTIMKKPFQTFLIVSLICLCFAPNQAAVAENEEFNTSVVLYDYKGKFLWDSQWGKITICQRALKEKLNVCGKAGIGVDGKFGKNSRDGVIRLLSCPGFENLSVDTNHPLYGTIHSMLWKRLLPDTGSPTVHERAFALVHTHEGTDYDRVEWNYDTPDDASALTWGPFGATVGWGNEVRAIMIRVKEKNPDLLRDLFGSEYLTASELMVQNPNNGYNLLKLVYSDLQRRQFWKDKLQALGALEPGRKAYDWYAFQSDEWLKPSLRRLYQLTPNAPSEATEIDYAFYLDLGVHASITQRRITGAKAAIEAEKAKIGRPLSPAERRRVIGQYFAQQVMRKWKKDRMGRNVVFYVEGIGKDNLTDEEIDAWQQRTGRRTSDYGLSDNRKFYPDFLTD
jgi:hypothetical protein